MIPSYFRIEILALRALLCSLVSKGLKHLKYSSHLVALRVAYSSSTPWILSLLSHLCDVHKSVYPDHLNPLLFLLALEWDPKEVMIYSAGNLDPSPPLPLSSSPLTPRRTLVAPFTKISNLFQEGIIKKISYERRAYESVDEKSLS